MAKIIVRFQVEFAIDEAQWAAEFGIAPQDVFKHVDGYTDIEATNVGFPVLVTGHLANTYGMSAKRIKMLRHA